MFILLVIKLWVKKTKRLWHEFLIGILDYLNYMAKCDILEKYEGLKGLAQSVYDLEPIKAWLEKRPVTDV